MYAFVVVIVLVSGWSLAQIIIIWSLLTTSVIGYHHHHHHHYQQQQQLDHHNNLFMFSLHFQSLFNRSVYTVCNVWFYILLLMPYLSSGQMVLVSAIQATMRLIVYITHIYTQRHHKHGRWYIWYRWKKKTWLHLIILFFKVNSFSLFLLLFYFFLTKQLCHLSVKETCLSHLSHGWR